MEGTLWMGTSNIEGVPERSNGLASGASGLVPTRVRTTSPSYMNSEEREAVEDFLEKASEYFETPVIVEGVRDKKALKLLGFKDIFTLRTPLYKIVESVKGKRAVILTDLDKEGKKIYARLKSDFSQRGIYIDDTLRSLLFRTRLRQIEGLTSYLGKFDDGKSSLEGSHCQKFP